MKRRKLRNIASACSSGSGESTPVLASLPEIAEEKTILPMTVPFGIGAPWSIHFTLILFLFSIPSLTRPFKPMGLTSNIMLTRSMSMLLKVHHRRILWLRVEKDRGEDLNHIHGKQKISQASVSAPLGWRLDHGGGPFED